LDEEQEQRDRTVSVQNAVGSNLAVGSNANREARTRTPGNSLFVEDSRDEDKNGSRLFNNS